MGKTIETQEVEIRLGKIGLKGNRVAPSAARGIVLFAHESGSGRHSSRNRYVAGALNEAGFATLLMDLLTEAEEAQDQWSGEFRFDIPLLAERLIGSTDWIQSQKPAKDPPIGYFGASTGAAAALIASTYRRYSSSAERTWKCLG